MKIGNRYSLPYIIAGLALVITIVSWLFTIQSVELYNSARFKNYSDEIYDDIEFRMKTYVSILAQTKSMYSINPYITRTSFREYFKALDIGKQYQGLQAIGFIERVKDFNLQSHISQARSEGFSDYRVWPKEPKRDEYFTIINIEPMSDRFRRKIGFDMSTENVRNAAMMEARDSGLAVCTNKINPVLEVVKENAFNIFVPLYKFKSDVSSSEFFL